MNTVRVPTSFDAERGPVATYARMIVLTVVLCVAVFAGAFELGRSGRPASTPGEQLASSVSTASAGPAIPVRLANSPPLAATVTAALARPAHAQLAKTAPTTPGTSQAAPVSAAPSTPTVAVATPEVPVSAPATPSPAPVSAPPVSRAPAQTSPAPAQRSPSSSGAGKSESGGSTSFDSSG
jgi:hypothetical protein